MRDLFLYKLDTFLEAMGDDQVLTCAVEGAKLACLIWGVFLWIFIFDIVR